MIVIVLYMVKVGGGNCYSSELRNLKRIQELKPHQRKSKLFDASSILKLGFCFNCLKLELVSITFDCVTGLEKLVNI